MTTGHFVNFNQQKSTNMSEVDYKTQFDGFDSIGPWMAEAIGGKLCFRLIEFKLHHRAIGWRNFEAEIVSASIGIELRRLRWASQLRRHVHHDLGQRHKQFNK